LHRNTITNIEVGHSATLEKVPRRAGVEFIEQSSGGPGVRLRKKQQQAGLGCPEAKSLWVNFHDFSSIEMLGAGRACVAWVAPAVDSCGQRVASSRSVEQQCARCARRCFVGGMTEL
jgi:hypothetical protein